MDCWGQRSEDNVTSDWSALLYSHIARLRQARLHPCMAYCRLQQYQRFLSYSERVPLPHVPLPLTILLLSFFIELLTLHHLFIFLSKKTTIRTMFAQSYNPFDCNNQLPHSNPPSPRTQDIRKRQDNARRQRMVEIERRHQAEFERMQRMEDKSKIEDHRRRTETRQRHIEEEEELRRRELDIFSRKDDDIRASRLPPLSFIYTSIPSNSSQESATLPPSLNALKSDEPVMTSEHKRKITG